MGVVVIGPFVLSAAHAAAVAGIIVFLVAAAILAHKIDRRFDNWASLTVAAGIIAARLGHVAAYWSAFAHQPLRILAVWQGGFAGLWAIPAILPVTLWRLPGRRLRLWSVVPLGAGLLVWGIIFRLLAIAAGAPSPVMVLSRLEGPPLNLAAPLARPRIINLWASWCPPCRREMPMLVRAAAAHPGIDILFADQGEGRIAVASFAHRLHIPADRVLLDPAGALGRYYGSRGLPTTLFIGRDGRLRTMQVGEIAPETLAAAMARLARIKSGPAPMPNEKNLQRD